MEGDGGMRGDNGDFEYIFTDLPIPSAFALKVKGDSMEPEFKEGVDLSWILRCALHQ